ncbi:hypothetical protein ACSHT2_06945 [Bradyrhizobium sp. PUT101]|uniref:hypothetical protein n=1 Tax=Bradyrhizobium sp. PUT101 TaxID=3447427 RepID=UPI003F8274AB
MSDLAEADQDQNANEDSLDERAYRLARLLLAKLELALSNEEVLQVLGRPHNVSKSKAALLLFDLDATKDQPAAATLIERLTKRMSPEFCDVDQPYSKDRTSVNCVEFAHQLAIGAIDHRLVSYGYEFLSRTSVQAIKSGKKDDEAIDAFIDVLAYYGDFRAAQVLLNKSSAGPSTHTARNHGDRATAVATAAEDAAP